MDITFLNGTADQHSVVHEALNDLLHLDTVTAFPFPWDIEFIPNPVTDLNAHNPLAVTLLTAGHPKTSFRDDFPHYPPEGDASDLDVARQAVIHELGHAAESNLATDVQGQVAALFGATQATLYPAHTAWQDSPGESMAETFKDAFLPQRFRATSNATRIPIPIRKYPEFRRLFRTGTIGTPGADALRSGPFVWQPALDFSFANDNPMKGLESYNIGFFGGQQRYIAQASDPPRVLFGNNQPRLPSCFVPPLVHLSAGDVLSYTVKIPDLTFFDPHLAGYTQVASNPGFSDSLTAGQYIFGLKIRYHGSDGTQVGTLTHFNVVGVQSTFSLLTHGPGKWWLGPISTFSITPPGSVIQYQVTAPSDGYYSFDAHNSDSGFNILGDNNSATFSSLLGIVITQNSWAGVNDYLGGIAGVQANWLPSIILPGGGAAGTVQTVPGGDIAGQGALKGARRHLRHPMG